MTGLSVGVSAAEDLGWGRTDRAGAGTDRTPGGTANRPFVDDPDHDVAVVLAFLNTLAVEHGTDVLDAPAAWRDWADRHGLGAAGDPEHARAVRDGLRAAVLGRGLPDTDHPAARVRVEVAGAVPMLVADDAVGAVLAAAVRLAVRGVWHRVKICAATECQRAFYDRSRNRSRTWCSMQVCGNRTKVRHWRERTRALAAS